MQHEIFAPRRGLLILTVMLAASGCSTFKTQCDAQTVSPALTEPLRPLPEPEGQSCGAILDGYVETIAVCAEWGAKYRALVEAIGD